MHELANRMLDHFRLVGDQFDLNALRHRLHEIGGRLLNLLAELEDVGAFCRHHADAERGLAFLAHMEGRGIDVTMGDGCDVAEAEHASVALDRSFGNGFGAIKRTGDAQRHALRGGLDCAGRGDIVLLGERVRTVPAA